MLKKGILEDRTQTSASAMSVRLKEVYAMINQEKFISR